ncbi:FAD-dependent monooxygenase [Acinetobacter larvae]|uniref:FAD-dependent monooxygenase n=1 Tax=Acinetobacter larvae TaxID=1789224 RepID=A0A1B2M118_9GAMM|nr:FAD-dependent monooxygenase [Acinetobacter larvae]AOA58894.1 FAD-dependent monooxygenase [Acinetobacter larvae]
MSEMLDVVIVGGGLVGGLTALLLAQGGVQATVLDAAPILDEATILAESNPRVLALNRATLHLLQRVDVWSSVQRFMPYTGMQVWNKNGYGDIHFGQASAQRPHLQHSLGAMVEPSLLNLAIQQKMQHQLSDYRSQVRVQRIEKINHGWLVVLLDGTELRTKLLIGADGANSFVRQQAMIDLAVLDYQQAGLTCAIQTTAPHQFVARQIFLETGPLAFLPMQSLISAEDQHWLSIVWTLPDDYAAEYARYDDAKFLQCLTQASQHMLGPVLAATARVQFPLKARHAQHYVQDGLALLGDAAHVIHPLAGQGVNIGCLDAAVLCDCLLHDLQRGAWAYPQTLQRYQHLRKGQNEIMMHSMSGIGWLERQAFFPIIWARNAGLKCVEQQPLLKDLFMSRADGLYALENTRYAP